MKRRNCSLKCQQISPKPLDDKQLFALIGAKIKINSMIRIFISILLFFVFTGFLSAQISSSGWLRYKTPEEAGWSSEKLSNICQNANASSVLLVHDGKVVFSYGDYRRRFKIHSMRKSILSALYGIAVNEGKIDPHKTLNELQITEKVPLTDNEKKARVINLLESRSGVYIPAAAESRSQQKERPKRGSYSAGEHYYYNNWDFNVLGTIYKKETGKDIFEEFNNKIARPLGMEDFRIIDGCYNYESISEHPAYNFKMTARDLARFGQLFLQNGQWNGSQIIPETWVNESTFPWSKTKDKNLVTDDTLKYGYLWWVIENYKSTRIYYAAGAFGQRVFIIPSLKIVLVIQSNSYIPDSISDVDFVADDIIFNSRVSESIQNPNIIALEEPGKTQYLILNDEEQRRYCKDYNYEDTTFSIKPVDGILVLTNYHYSYNFQLFPITPELFYAEDIDMYLFFKLDEKGIPVKAEIHKSPLVKKIFDIIIEKGMDEAVQKFTGFRKQIKSKEELIYLAEKLNKRKIDTIDMLRLNALCFPYSYQVQQQLNDTLMKRYDLVCSAKIFKEIVQKLKQEGKRNTKSEWLFEIITSQAFPQILGEEEKRKYIGDYGLRHIVADGNDLLYYVNPNNRTRLYKISENEFSLKDQFFRRIKFEKENEGKIVKLVIYYYRDSFEESVKDK